MRDVDAFQLGYLPHLMAAQFDAWTLALVVRDGGTSALGKRAESMLAALPERGPEVVSCIWQMARVLAEQGVTPPAEPQTIDEAQMWMDVARGAVHEHNRSTYEHARRCGAAERALDQAVRLSVLLLAAPDDARLLTTLANVRREVARLVAGEPATDCPTTKLEAAMITVALQRALQTIDRPVRAEMFVELASAKVQVQASARSLEAVAWGTPREAIRAWFEKRIPGRELLRRVAEHHRWNLLVRELPGGDAAPRTMSDGKVTSMFAFSDRVALASQPAFLASEREDEKHVLTIVGALLLRSIPGDVDVLVLDANDPATTINYQRTPNIQQVAGDVAFELAACNWSQLDVEVLRSRSYWVLVGESSLHATFASDGYGRATPAVYSSEDALDAHLASLTNEQREAFANSRRSVVPGSVLFPTLAQRANSFILNPKGARSREFNRKTLEQLANPPVDAGTT